MGKTRRHNLLLQGYHSSFGIPLSRRCHWYFCVHFSNAQSPLFLIHLFLVWNMNAVISGYGMYASLLGAWSYASALILAIHGYFNVFVRLQSGWKTFKMRRNAAENMQLLARASRSQLDELEDVCAICIVVSPLSVYFDYY